MGCWSPVLTSCSGAGAGVSGGRQKPHRGGWGCHVPAERELRGRMAPARRGDWNAGWNRGAGLPPEKLFSQPAFTARGSMCSGALLPGVPCVFAEHLPQELRLVRSPALHCNCTKSNPSAQTPLPLSRWGRRGTERQRLPFGVTRLTHSVAQSPAGVIRPESLPSEHLHWWSRS